MNHPPLRISRRDYDGCLESRMGLMFSILLMFKK